MNHAKYRIFFTNGKYHAQYRFMFCWLNYEKAIKHKNYILRTVGYQEAFDTLSEAFELLKEKVAEDDTKRIKETSKVICEYVTAKDVKNA